MRRGTIFIILFVVIAIGVVAASQFLRAQPPLEIQVAVSPLAEPWVSDAIAAFNATNPVVNSTRRVHYQVEAIDDSQVWLDDSRRWTPENHPQAWIPAASFSIDFANESRLPFEIVEPSLARTMLVWGGFTNSVDEVTNGGVEVFDWDSVAEDARDLNLAFSNPARTLSGLSVVLSGAGDHHESTTLTGVEVNDRDFRDWISPVIESVPNFNTLGASVAETLASRGASVGAIGLLPESEWLTNLRGQLTQENNPIALSYPQYSVEFDFPLSRWADTTVPTNNDETAAVEALGRWLSSAAQQTNAQGFGLRPAQGDPSVGAFIEGENYGALVSPTYQMVEPPSRNDLRQLAEWVNGIIN
jgi:hypothetical protein